MFKYIALTFALTVFGSTSVNAQHPTGSPDLATVADTKAWKLSDAIVETLEVDGRRAVRLSVGGDWVGLALPVGWHLKTGTIDVDLKGKDLKQRSFLGVAFNVVDQKTFEAVYFRPFNFKAEEPFRKRSVQYIALPENTWQKLRENTPGQFENSINPVPDPDEWFHARIEVTDSQLRVFVNGATEASLTVGRLARGGDNRGVGLFVSTVEGIYANLKITPATR